MNLTNGDEQPIQINRSTLNFRKQDIIHSHTTAKIKDYSKSKISYKDNSAHNLFMPQYMMGANYEFLLATTCFFDGHHYCDSHAES